MLRSILVALDATAASSAAQDLAIDLAKRFECEITGLAILDREYLTAPAAVGIGGMAYKQHLDQVKLEEAKAFLGRLEQGFHQKAEAAELDWHVLEAEGVPHDLLARESGRHDLLLVGKDTDFHFDVDPATAATVQRLLQDNARPLIVCPDSAPADGPVLVAYDGSLPASRALHMLALLEIVRSRPVHVLSVDEDQAEADRRAAYASELLTKHGLDVSASGISTEARPAEIVLAEIETLGATLAVMGTSGHSALHEFFLGSGTTRLLDACPCPLFVYH